MVAETGTLVVVESEGNGRMCLTLPETLISVVGIEKIVPTWRDLEVFLQTLPRSSTAERMNPYTSMWTGTTDGDGPRDLPPRPARQRPHRHPRRRGRPPGAALHPLLGLPQRLPGLRARRRPRLRLASTPARSARSSPPNCAAPQARLDASLPYASSLCGACYEVCPVAIDIPEVLVHLRERVVEGGPVTRQGTKVVLKPAKGHAAERAAMRAARWAFDHPGALRARPAARLPHPPPAPADAARPGQGVERHPRPARRARGAVPRLVAAAPNGGNTETGPK